MFLNFMLFQSYANLSNFNTQISNSFQSLNTLSNSAIQSGIYGVDMLAGKNATSISKKTQFHLIKEIDRLPNNQTASNLGYSKVNPKIIDNVKWTKTEAQSKTIANKLIKNNYISSKEIQNGRVYKLKDGTFVTIRSKSKTSNTMTIEINNGKDVIKIHSLDGIK